MSVGLIHVISQALDKALAYSATRVADCSPPETDTRHEDDDNREAEIAAKERGDRDDEDVEQRQGRTASEHCPPLVMRKSR